MVFFFVDRSFTYKAHCVLWQLKWTDLLDLNCDPTTTVLLPSVPRRPRTYDPSRQLRRGYPLGLKTLMHARLPGRARLLRLQAGSSGLLARKLPSRCGGGGGCPCRVHRAVRRLPARTHGGLGCSQGTLKSPRYYIVITVHSLEPASRWQGRLTDFILCPQNTDPS